MADPVKKGVGYEQLFDLPDNVVGEIFAGDLITHPRPAPRHVRAASMLGILLGGHFDYKLSGRDDGWWILHEPECHLAEDIVVPDITGWRKTTMAELPETAWFEIPPDWVCEVLSPATSKFDRGVKRDIYAREKVGYYWIVDPLDKVVEVFALERERWTLVSTAQDEQVVNLVPFESLPFDLSALWA
ncbi:hypothetical protein AB833_21200 [Chromatiales bacterium (ex Bugula neritina AB1)]|nr:hypothetical protein AB833_21200 [Chromatiales bacterium (ex Bugula neritina AB1)]